MNIDVEQLRQAYGVFFDSDAGKYFRSQIEKLIDLNHEHAEGKPDYSRDFVQRAKGNREVLTHITVVLSERKGKKL